MQNRNLNHLKVGIIGGSIAGCAAAILLIRQGADVSIFERSLLSLNGRGAGIGLPDNLLQQFISLDLFDSDIPRLTHKSRSFYINDPEVGDKKIWDQDFFISALNWSDIFSNLRKRIPHHAYHGGESLISFRKEGSKYHIKTSKGQYADFDILIAADGIDSIIRKQLFPNTSPTYAGYVAWRGTIYNENEQTSFNYYVFPNGHLVIYSIPNKLLNWCLYENYQNKLLRDLLVDKDGVSHKVSLPPDHLSNEHIEHLHKLAKRALPQKIADIISKTPSPFLQAIFDFQIADYAKDNIVFVGDAASVLRPHTASGVLKALNDSISLIKCLSENNDSDISTAILQWNNAQLKMSKQQETLAKNMGEALVLHSPDWTKMDFASMENWWAQIMSGQSWYATSSSMWPHKKNKKNNSLGLSSENNDEDKMLCKL